MVVVISHQADDLLLGQSLIGDALAKKLPNDDSETVDVREFVYFLLVSNHLWRHPLESPQPIGVVVLPLSFLLLAREAEIAELHLPVLTDQHVGALEVPMQNLLHVVEVDHALDDIEQDFVLLGGGEFLLLFVELVEQRAIFQVFGDEGVLVGGDAHAHVEHDVGVFEVADDLQLLHEVLLVAVLARLQVVLYRDRLPHVLTLVDLTETALPNQLQLLDVLLADQEIQTTVLLQKFIELADFRGLVGGLVVSALAGEDVRLLFRRGGGARPGEGGALGGVGVMIREGRF